MARIGTHIGYANVMATVAVFIALGGSSYAAATLARNSVKTEQVKNGEIKTADIGKNAVTADKVKDHSLLAEDFKPGQLAAGAQGPPGERGPQGPKGDTGTVDTAQFYSRTETDSRFLGKSAKAADADMLDGLDSTEFLRARTAQGAGPVVLTMPATPGAKAETTLIDAGRLTIVGECENSGGLAVARVGVRHAVELFVLTGASGGKAAPFATSNATKTIAQATETGGLPVWDHQRRDFSAVSNPASGLASIQGSAVAMTHNTDNECYVSAWGFAG